MKDKLEAFLASLRERLSSKPDKTALEKDLENPEALAAHVARNIGSQTRPIKF